MNLLIRSLSRTSDGAFIVDGSHRIVFWNKAAEEILGYTAKETIGFHCFEILGGRDDAGQTLCHRFCRLAIHAAKGELMPNQDVRVCTQKGDYCWLNVSAFAYSGGAKSPTQVIVHLFRDVTEQKKFQQFASSVMAASERLQRKRSNSSNLASMTVSQLGRLTGRELQVLELLTHGQGTNDIADALTISLSTVRNHIQNILGKLGVHSRLEAIAYAYQHGLGAR